MTDKLPAEVCRQKSPSRWAHVVSSCLVSGLAMFSAGCQLPLAILEKMFPTEKVPATFGLPADHTILVFTDDLENPVAYPPVKRKLTEEINKVLVDKKLAKDVVPYNKLIDLRTAEPDFNRLAVASVGRRLGATLVIYVNIKRFSLKDTPIEALWRGRFSANVRVVDVKEGRLWPDERDGQNVSIKEGTVEDPSETYGAELAGNLAEKLGQKIAGLFHAHEVDRHKPKETESPFD